MLLSFHRSLLSQASSVVMIVAVSRGRDRERNCLQCVACIVEKKTVGSANFVVDHSATAGVYRASLDAPHDVLQFRRRVTTGILSHSLRCVHVPHSWWVSDAIVAALHCGHRRQSHDVITFVEMELD